MPKIGIFKLKISLEISGALSLLTEAGPPDKIIAAGLNFLTFSIVIL